jgi:hypothetical protein
MSDLDDFSLGGSDPGSEPPLEPAPPEPRSWLPIVAAGVALVAALGAAAYFMVRPARTPTATPAPTLIEAEPSPLPSPSALPSGLPPLADSDVFVRELAAGLSSHPQLALWLQARGLVRTFATAVLNIADGRSPAPLVPFLAPRQKFSVLDTNGSMVADPKAFRTYDALTEAVASLDTAGVARVYRTLLPLLSAAYKELGYPDADFSRTTERALAHLLQTPVPAGDIAVRKDGPFYRYADPKLEGLSLAQKQLLRTGPTNARRLQEKLRALYKELGFTP